MRVRWSMVALVLPCMLTPVGAAAEMPKDRPFAMRKVELGITIDELRQFAIPRDDERTADPRVVCSLDGERGVSFVLAPNDVAAGIAACKWLSREAGYDWEGDHWVALGTGKGLATFRFLPVDGAFRLFEISVGANTRYYPGILDALTRNYGPARTTVEPFQTVAGANYTSTRSVWDNGLSSITLVQRCGELQQYCLTYEHRALGSRYRAFLESQAARAAEKI